MFSINNHQSNILTAVSAGAIVAGGFVWYMTKAPPPTKMINTDYNNQSIVLDEENFIRTSQFPKLPELRKGKVDHIETVYDIFQCGLTHGEHEPCLGFKPEVNATNYHWLSYREVECNSIKLGSGIINRLNQKPGQSTKICIFMKNCVEWIYIDQGCMRYSMVPVPLYDTLGENACKYIINRVKCEVIFVDTKVKIDFLIKEKSEMLTLKYIVTLNECEVGLKEACKKQGLHLILFSDLLDYGTQSPVPLLLPKRSDIYSILFTSGTTGTPKGCPITHEGMIASLTAAVDISSTIKFGNQTEVHLSFLPLTHIYEKLVHILMFMFTGKIAFFSGEIRFLGEEMKIIKPTILFAVPRILNRIYDKVMSSINKSKLVKYLYEMGLSSKLKEVEIGIIRKNSFWDYLLFKRIQSILGGNIGIIMVGSAPVSSDVLNFFRAVMGCAVFEGYGQTETTGPITLILSGDNEPGHVGIPVPESQLKLCDVPDLDIVVSRDLQGEICVKGAMCIKEYYDDSEMTAKLIDAEGWLHTGDVGMWTEKGQLKIVDRCKHIFKLSQGEYIAPEKLENLFSLSNLVAQIFVTGDSLKDYCVAVVVPDLDGWNATGRKHYNSVQDICNDDETPDILQKDLELLGRKNKLCGFEIIKKVCLYPTAMTVENGLLTPTLKLKRQEAKNYFHQEIENMYS